MTNAAPAAAILAATPAPFMSALQVAALVVTAIGATAVVVIRRPVRQVIALSTYGIVLGVLFIAFQAPDVTLSIISVGSVILPLLLLLALAKMRKQEH